MERAFWDIVEQIAKTQGMAIGKFLTALHDEVLELSGATHNFTSLLRCACLMYVEEIRGNSDAEAALNREVQSNKDKRVIAVM